MGLEGARLIPSIFIISCCYLFSCEISEKIFKMKELFSYQDIFNAYRKMKNYYYFDSNSLSIRYRISVFEKDLGLDGKMTLEKFTEKLKKTLLPIYELLNSDKGIEILKSKFPVSYKLLPKSFAENEKDNNSMYISNSFAYGKVVVDKCNFIIDAPVEALIISALWLENVGVKLSNNISEDNYAYRLNVTEDMEGKRELNHGLSMFKPYYVGYQDWRDKGLKEAKRLLDNGKDVTILSLDIKRFFYSVRLNVHHIANLYWLQDLYGEMDPKAKRLCDLMQTIHEMYSASIGKILDNPITQDEKEKGLFVLPVGLMSSGVLANLFLSEFDAKVKENVCPAYYGRYVDDMLFVFSDRYLLDVEENPIREFIEFNFKEVLHYGNDEEILIDMAFHNPSVLKIQGNKVLFEHFLSSGSHAAIDIFMRDLGRQRSEFRFLPDEDLISEEFDRNAYQLFYNDSSKKLRTIDDFRTDKFGASKYLANRILLSQLSDIDFEESKKFDEKKVALQLLNYFRGKTAVEMYSLWEKVAMFFIVNEDWHSLVKFYFNLRKTFDAIHVDESTGIQNNDLRECLFEILDYSISMSLALYPRAVEYSKKYFRNSKTISLLENDAIIFRNANMFKHNYVGIMGINFTSALFEKEVSLLSNQIPTAETKLNEVVCMLAPRFIHYDELNIVEIIVQMKRNFGDKKDNTATCSFNIDFVKLKQNYNEINTRWQSLFLGKENNCKGFSDDNFVRCASEEDGNYTKRYVTITDTVEIGKKYESDKKIAIANDIVKESDFMHVVTRKSSIQSLHRRKSLCKIINFALAEQADILVMPELSVPFGWLGFLAKQVCHSGMGIVCGMEYAISTTEYMLNTVATILPVKTKYGNTCVVDLRVKNYYSPKEKILLEGYRYNLPSESNPCYTLFHWRNSYFSVYNCFELADIKSRSLFQSEIDFLIAVEFNKDVHYYADVVSSWARDVHAFIVQVNTSQYGDSKIVMPSKTDTKTFLQVKGGENPIVMVATLPIKKLRDFQLPGYQIQMQNGSFKFTPPHFNHENVEKRIRNFDLI